MGELGWSTEDTDAMELWQIGRFLGAGGTGQPVIRGTRRLELRQGPVMPAIPDPRTVDPDSWGTTAGAEQAMLALMRSRR